MAKSSSRKKARAGASRSRAAGSRRSPKGRAKPARPAARKASKKKTAAKPSGKAKPSGRAKPSGTAKAPAGRRSARPGGSAPSTGAASAAAPSAGRAPGRRGRRGSSQRRGLDGKTYSPGELLLPGGAQDPDEIQYLLRGCVAAEDPAGEAGAGEVLARLAGSEGAPEKPDIGKTLTLVSERFEGGTMEPLLPARAPGNRRTFASVVERARHRRREIGAFLRGLDLGSTETSHMDPHGEGSLQNLMEWAARLEVLMEADEPEQADYLQFHRVLDQLESNTEALILDVELTLRRLRDRLR
jgi:hypothetical protein